MARDSNAKNEFINHTSGRCKVLCATIEINLYDDETSISMCIEANLGRGWNQEEMVDFLSKIDHEYDSGYGTQHVFGTIWYEDGTWSERGEYDGSEWWAYCQVPPIPENLRRDDVVRDNKINNLIND